METLQPSGLWHVVLAEENLVTQAGLKHEDFEQDFGFFRYKGRIVIISLDPGKDLVVSMEGQEDTTMTELMAGFSKVVEYEPFCKYVLQPEEGSKAPPLLTYEWDKVDPKGRFKALSQKENVTGLVRIPRRSRKK